MIICAKLFVASYVGHTWIVSLTGNATYDDLHLQTTVRPVLITRALLALALTAHIPQPNGQRHDR